MVELGRAHTAHAHGAVQQILRPHHGQLPDIDGKPAAADGDLNQMVLRSLELLHRTHHSGDFDELAIFLAAGELLEGRQLWGWQFAGPHHMQSFQHHDGSILARTAGALDFDNLAGGKPRRVGGILQVNASSAVLDEARIERLIKKSHHAAQVDTHRLLRLRHRQRTHRRRRAQFFRRCLRARHQ